MISTFRLCVCLSVCGVGCVSQAGCVADKQTIFDRRTLSVRAKNCARSLPLASSSSILAETARSVKLSQKLFLNYKRFTVEFQSNHYLICRFNFNFHCCLKIYCFCSNFLTFQFGRLRTLNNFEKV